VAFLTGDIHTFFAGKITPSGREVATEFVGGAITSQGIADQYGDGAAAFPAEAVVAANNPHLKLGDQQYQGYGVPEARPDERLVQYKAPRTVKTPTASSFTLARFRVARGTPSVQVPS
jgi:alkaline phosphatase D